MAERSSPLFLSLLRNGLALHVSIVVICFAACIAGTASSWAAAASPDRIRHGSEIFQTRCIACHNKKPGDNSPFGPPNLYSVFKGAKAITTVQAQTIIKNGRSPMPSFRSVLSNEDVQSVVTYLKIQAASEK
jgi:mono/diheme cytochrome c family protein